MSRSLFPNFCVWGGPQTQTLKTPVLYQPDEQAERTIQDNFKEAVVALMCVTLVMSGKMAINVSIFSKLIKTESINQTLHVMYVNNLHSCGQINYTSGL